MEFLKCLILKVQSMRARCVVAADYPYSVQPQSCDLRVYSTGDSYSQLIFSADNIPVGQAANIYLPVYTSDNNVNYTVFFINPSFRS